MKKEYEMVIGLEVHVELNTKTKIFCSCKTDFGAQPNTQCCPVCTGMPGTLPVLNRQVVEKAVKAGIATNCTIARLSKMDRKHYFYPDLPKAYQISQYDQPLCEHGFIDIVTAQGQKRIGITRIHMEEDAGKLIHDEKKGTLIDCNRCGVPLIEIVSEPDLRSAEEVLAYLRKLRAIILYTGVSDCKMNEGSFRCDVNLSVRPLGQESMGTRTEMKNLNSFQFIDKAVRYEFKRQVEVLESGGTVVQETRRYDQVSGKTLSMRAKEDADDYRYFPDPDLPPIRLSEEEIAGFRAQIPSLPDERKAMYQQRYGLSAYDAEQLVAAKAVADYFEQAAQKTAFGKLLANLMLGEIFSLMEPDSDTIPIAPEHLAQLATLTGEEVINSSTAKRLVRKLWIHDVDPRRLVEEEGLARISDPKELERLVAAAVEADPKSASDYQNGKQAALKALMGSVMKQSGGRADPIVVQQLLKQKLL